MTAHAVSRKKGEVKLVDLAPRQMLTITQILGTTVNKTDWQCSEKNQTTQQELAKAKQKFERHVGKTSSDYKF